jgi:hypothetical protein
MSIQYPCKHGNTAPRDKSKRCSCEPCRTERRAARRGWLERRFEKNPDFRAIHNTRMKARRHQNPAIQLWHSAKARAKEHGIPFTISKQDIIVPERCPILGVVLSHGDGRPNANSPTLDRQIPGLGYIPGNICVISHRANSIKSDATANEIRLVADWLDHTLQSSSVIP